MNPSNCEGCGAPVESTSECAYCGRQRFVHVGRTSEDFALRMPSSINTTPIVPGLKKIFDEVKPPGFLRPRVGEYGPIHDGESSSGGSC